MPEPTCIICGCTESHACAGGCSWLAVQLDENAGVCSACLPAREFPARRPGQQQLRRERVAAWMLDRFLIACGATA